MALLSILLSQNPVRKLEVTYQEFIDGYLDRVYNVVLAYDEYYIDNPERANIEEKLNKCLQEVKKEIITNVGYLANDEKYSYLLMVHEWVHELSINKGKLDRKEFDWDWNKDFSEGTLAALNENTRIVNETLFPIYESKLDRLLDYHVELIKKYEQGTITHQSPMEIAEIRIRHKPQFTLSKDVMLQTIKGKENLTVLNIYQTALLFDLLKEKNAIIDLKPKSFAHVLSRLTPHSEHNLRTDALNSIKQIKEDHTEYKDKTISTPNQNLLAVKTVLTSILREIEQQIKTNSEKK